MTANSNRPDPYTIFADLPTESEFAEAYAWLYGATLKAGRAAYYDCKEAGNPDYIRCVVESFRRNAKRSFADD